MRACQTCGGPLVRSGNYYICEYCRHKWEIDSADDIHAVHRANAWEALRNGDFEKAAELFEEIIIKESKNYEAYWGRALALSGIVYVNDLREDKKVPTCHNITEISFLNHKDVQMAISLAPKEIADEYRKQAQYIEKVRVEWLEKASKEPAYDIFISYKDSDKENGIERTQDSYDAQDLYYALVEKGYKVFFSHVSLRNKTSEQYEPYIYNAIKTAKVMIVFGEKAEYFNAIWVKNEWSRFKARIEKGEKHKNSLVVAFKNMNPGDLPSVLKKQCLNAADITFLSDLIAHVKRVIDETKRNVHLEKIEIASGQIAKKATAISVNAVKTREVGMGAIAETSLSEKQSINLVYAYLSEHQWQEASNLVSDVLFDNPTCAEAIWCKLLVAHQVPNNEKLIDRLDKFSATDFANVEKVLNYASQSLAQTLLVLLYGATRKVTAATYKRILDVVLPFSFGKRQNCIDTAFSETIAQSKLEPFKRLLDTLQPDDVDKYIAYNYRYAVAANDVGEKIECLQRVLSVDEGNIAALREIVAVDLISAKYANKRIEDFENLLKFAPDISEEIRSCLSWLGKNLADSGHCAFAKRVLQYYTGELSTLKAQLVSLCKKIIQMRLFAEAEYFLNLAVSFDAQNPDIYWLLCLMRVKASSEDAIIAQNNLLKDVPEFNKYLSLVDDRRQKQCISISKRQQERVKKDKYEKELTRLKREKERLEEELTKIPAHTGKMTGYGYAGMAVVWFVAIIGFLFCVMGLILLILKGLTPLVIIAGVIGGWLIKFSVDCMREEANIKENRERERNLSTRLSVVCGELSKLEEDGVKDVTRDRV